MFHQMMLDFMSEFNDNKWSFYKGVQVKEDRNSPFGPN